MASALLYNIPKYCLVFYTIRFHQIWPKKLICLFACMYIYIYTHTHGEDDDDDDDDDDGGGVWCMCVCVTAMMDDG